MTEFGLITAITLGYVLGRFIWAGVLLALTLWLQPKRRQPKFHVQEVSAEDFEKIIKDLENEGVIEPRQTNFKDDIEAHNADILKRWEEEDRREAELLKENDDQPNP